MSLKEKIIKHIREKTGNPEADLWTLKFNKEDANVKLENIFHPYINGRKVRTNEEIDQEYKHLSKVY